MAITRTQIAKQLLANGGRTGFQGGGADMGAPERAQERADRGYGSTNSVERDTGLERGRQRNIALDKQLLDTPYEPFNTPFASINFLGNTLGKFGHKKTTKFFSDNSIGGKINPATGKPFGYGPQGYSDYMDQRTIGNVNAFGNPTTQYDDQDDNDAYLIPTSGIMAEASSDMDQEPEIEEDEGLRLAFRANGGRIGFRGGDAAKSDAASGRDAGRADPGGGVDDRSDAGQTAVNNAAIMMARMQNQNLNEIKNPNLIEKFPGGVRAIDKINLDRMLANKNLNTITTDDDDEDANAIDTVFSPDIATNLQTVFGTGLGNRQQIEKNILDSMADGGRAGLAEGGMPYEGGIMDLESARQMYGLGKLVKKVTRSVKKIAKSPIGKAAILAATYKIGGGKLFGGEGFQFGNLPGLGFLKPASTASIGSVANFAGDRLAFNAARTAAGASSKGLGIGTLIAGTSLAAGALTPEQEEEAQTLADSTGIDIEQARNSILAARRDDYKMDFRARGFRAEGGPAEGKEPVAKKTMPLLDMGGKEMDLRAEGGFVPIGRMEKADDVPARLSKNEFVFTADAVRNAGEGDVDKGAEVMYNMMKNLESGGDVSEESQGLDGARKMFQTSQRLEEVL
jgi:hypothetical protein